MNIGDRWQRPVKSRDPLGSVLLFLLIVLIVVVGSFVGSYVSRHGWTPPF